MWATIAASFLIGLASVCAKRSAATARVLVTGAGSGLAATLIWLVIVGVAPPIPASVGLALVLTVVAAGIAVLANSGESGTTSGRLLAGLLATVATMVLIFVGVVVLAHWGPDSIIPSITPHAPPANRISESRIEIVDPYVLIIVLSAIAATALHRRCRCADPAAVQGRRDQNQTANAWRSRADYEIARGRGFRAVGHASRMCQRIPPARAATSAYAARIAKPLHGSAASRVDWTESPAVMGEYRSSRSGRAVRHRAFPRGGAGRLAQVPPPARHWRHAPQAGTMQNTTRSPGS